MIKHILTDINRAIGRIFGISISGISKKPNLTCPWKKEVEFLKGCQNIKFHKGLFEDTLHSVRKEKFCFVHVDCDLYWSVRQCCEFFYPRMVGGG